MEVIYHWNLNVIWYQLNILTKGVILSFKYLIEKALKLRQNTFHAYIEHGEAHFGGDFSMIEMLLALHEEVLKTDDKFILSKAHASFPLCLLLREKGLHPKLRTHLELDPDMVPACSH